MSEGAQNLQEDRSMVVRLSILLFLQFFIWGAWYISIPGYVSSVPNMGHDPFWAYKAIPIAAMIAPFFLGLFADRFFNTEKILGVLFALAGVFMLLMPYVAGLAGQVVNLGSEVAPVMAEKINFLGMDFLKHKLFSHLTLLHSLCFMPTLALTASLSFNHLKNGSSSFPKVRMWGTLGWIAGGAALIIFNQSEAGKIIVKGESTAGQFYLGGIAALLLGVYSFFLPKTPAPKKGERIDVGSLLFTDVWKEFKSRSFFIFVLCSFLLCIPLQAYYAYLQAQMGAQDISNVPFWKNTGTWIEAGMMCAMPFFFYKLGVKKMIAVGIVAWIVRYALFPLAAGAGVVAEGSGFAMGSFDVPLTSIPFLLIIGGVALHGLCYDFFFVTGQIYVDQVTDTKIRGQAQSMIVFFTQGLGMYLGAMLNEALFIRAFDARDVGEAYGRAGSAEYLSNWSSFWWPLCIMAAVILVIFLVAFKHKDQPDAEFKH